MATTKKLSEAQRHVLQRMADGARLREHWPAMRETWYSLSSTSSEDRPRSATIDNLRERGYVKRVGAARWGSTSVDYRLTDAGRAALRDAIG